MRKREGELPTQNAGEGGFKDAPLWGQLAL
jgi:hypothetical protein